MIRGPSGGGKTTLLNQIGTIDTASEGIISNDIGDSHRNHGSGGERQIK
jgi:ABC-type lipoprotein export system ATPase subunit